MASVDIAKELILVTGASGFIAAWIVKEFLDKGFRVRGTVRDPTNEKKVKFLKDLPGAKERLELVPLDLSKSDAAHYAEIVKDVTLIAHTASPFPAERPKNDDELIIPAVEGTLGVLRAALKSETVRSVVITSSTVAIGTDGKKSDKDWAVLEESTPYGKSKIKAEHAAWDLWNTEKPKWSLCTINPSLVQGASLSNEVTTSSGLTARVLGRKMPFVPQLSINMVDVHDVAHAHVQALILPPDQVSGKRFILCNKAIWFRDMSAILATTFGPMGYKPPSFEAPYALMWVLSFLDKNVALMLPNLGKVLDLDNSLSRDILKIEYRDLERSLTESGHSLIYYGTVPKTPEYKSPSEGWAPINSA